jgi:RNA polymerase sigma factor (sigma-70 family)
VSRVGSDRGWLERLSRGDEGAFDEVYEAIRPRLYGFLVRLCPNQWIAEEILQETFMRLVEHHRALPAHTDLAAWLFTVARNLAHSHGRWRAVGAAVRAALRVAPRPEPPSPLERLAENEELRSLERALASLPTKSREILLLTAVEGFATVEVASILGVRAEALRQRLSRARKALIAAMEAESGGTEEEVLDGLGS